VDIQIAALCDAAADYEGKLSLLGAFDTIIASTLPAVHPQCALALRIVFRKEEEGAHQLRLSFVDEDGRIVVPVLETAMDVSKNACHSERSEESAANGTQSRNLANDPSASLWDWL
jgi:hypothetical protein